METSHRDPEAVRFLTTVQKAITITETVQANLQLLILQIAATNKDDPVAVLKIHELVIDPDFARLGRAEEMPDVSEPTHG